MRSVRQVAASDSDDDEEDAPGLAASFRPARRLHFVFAAGSLAAVLVIAALLAQLGGGTARRRERLVLGGAAVELTAGPSGSGVCQDTTGWTNLWSACGSDDVFGKNASMCGLTPGASWPSTAGWTCLAYKVQGWCGAEGNRADLLGSAHNSPETNCCVCREAESPECNTDTGGSCMFGDCDSWRGDTTCEHGKCVCQEGYCADSSGTCQYDVMQEPAARETGCSTLNPGTCEVTHKCDSWRGADCQTSMLKPDYGKCFCPSGYCGSNDGICFKNRGINKDVIVAHVNQQSPTFPGGPVTTALCISGGGARSLSAAMGQLRALNSLGLMPNVDLISSVSGGTWATAIYMFAQQEPGALLGSLTNASQLTLSVLDETPPPLGAVVLNKTTELAAKLVADGVPSHILWLAMVSEAFLMPFGLGAMDMYIAANSSHVQDIIQRNPQYSTDDFTIPQTGRAKSFVMSATQLAPIGYTASSRNAVSFQVSPDFSGVPFYPNDSVVNYISGPGKELRDVLIGGGLVETFALGGAAPSSFQQQDGSEAGDFEASGVPLSLAKAVGMSSNGPGSALANLHSIPGFTGVDNPTMTIWSVPNKEHQELQGARTHEVADGGNLDDTGICAALQRGASKIAAMINGASSLSLKTDYCTTTSSAALDGSVSAQLANKFGYLKTANPAEFLENNQVFAQAEFFPILCALQGLKKAGKPLVWQGSLQVQPNPWWGIPGGNTVDVAFFWLDKSAEFEGLLPEDTQGALGSGLVGELQDFPNFRTCFQNPPDLTALTARQVNLLAAQTEYSILQNEQVFLELLG